MNRRSFITKALAGLAVVPLIGKLVQAVESDYNKPIRVALGPIDTVDRIWFDGREVYNRYPTPEMLRKQMLAFVRSNDYMETNADAVSRMFEDFNGWAQIDEFCEEHGLIIQARPNGKIRISMPWRITVINKLA